MDEITDAYQSLMRSARLSEHDRARVNVLMTRITALRAVTDDPRARDDAAAWWERGFFHAKSEA